MSDDKYAGWTLPLSAAQLAEIEPTLHELAVRYSRCEADRLDLVQEATVALMTATEGTVLDTVAKAMRAYISSVEKTQLDNASDLFPAEYTYEDVDPFVLEEVHQLKWLRSTGAKADAAVLYWREGLTMDQVADRLDVHPMTVMNWIAAMREELRDWLAN